jgi:hypothetical protein
MQEVGLYPIISTGSFYDGLINLNKFFKIAGAIILINVACLELGRPPDPPWVALLEHGTHSSLSEYRPLLGIVVVDLMFCPGCASDL